MKCIVIAVGALALATTVVPAVAGASASDGAEATKAKSASDPNRVICRRVETIGSRLGSKRICQTAAQWAAQEAENRQDIERRQTTNWKSD